MVCWTSGKPILQVEKLWENTKTVLEKIEIQNRKLVAKINQDLLKDAYDEEGLEYVRDDKHIQIPPKNE